MSKGYDQQPRQYKPSSSAKRKTESIRAKFEERHTLEELSRMFQIFIAELEQRSVEQVDYCSLYFSAYDCRGDRMAFPNAKGEPLSVMTIGYKRPTAPKTDEPEISCLYGGWKSRSR